MKKTLFLTLLFLFSLAWMPRAIAGTAGPRLTLAVQGKSHYKIRVLPDAGQVELRAASEFQKYFEQVTGARLSISNGSASDRDTSVWIVSAAGRTGIPMSADWDRLGADGYAFRSDRQNILIAGGTDKGVLYGVYFFFEKYLGCRKYSPAAEVISSRPTVLLDPLNYESVPAFEFRDAHTPDQAYCDWHGLDRHRDVWGMYVHTFNALVPPGKYYRDHPEYYSLLPGGRVTGAQLCLSNPDVLKIVSDGLAERMAQDPDKKYWSVSQNDTYSPCECSSCKRLDSLYGGPSGTMIWFVNQVAEQFPDKQISTLAYQYTRQAPRNIRPRENVNIFLCSIECNRSKALEKDPSSMGFVKDVQDWTALTHNILLWDYTIQFRNMVSPFPNLRVLQPNLQFFRKYGIPMMFEQGNPRIGAGEMSELRSYLTAKLLWNPDLSVDSLVTDFVLGFYGRAGKVIKLYINTMHDALETAGEDLGIYGFPKPSEKGYLSLPKMEQYGALFDMAEEQAWNDPRFLERVRIARLPLMFATIEQAKMLGTGPGGFFMQANDGRWIPKPALVLMTDTFVKRCVRSGIERLNENGCSPFEYKSACDRFLSVSMQPSLAFGLTPLADPPPSLKYCHGDIRVLTDGLKGLDDYNLNWIGWEGEDMNIIIDLGRIMKISSASVGFMQDINAWIFMPKQVEISVSADGMNYETVKSRNPETAEKEPGFREEDMDFTFTLRDARYVKVRATSMKTCPLWHKGAGGKCWIFADEIIIRP